MPCGLLVFLSNVMLALSSMTSGTIPLGPQSHGKIPSAECARGEVSFCSHSKGKCTGSPTRFVHCDTTKPGPFNINYNEINQVYRARHGGANFLNDNRGSIAHIERATHLADLDGDGDIDLLFTHCISSYPALYSVRWFERLGDGRWDLDKHLVDMDEDSGVFVVDWNGDGRKDILAYDSLHLQNNTSADLSFLPPVQLVSSKLPRGMKPLAVDWDNDGDLDLFYADLHGNLDVENRAFLVMSQLYFERQPDGSLEFSTNPLRDLTLGFISPVDLDGDGDLDIVSLEGSGRIQYFERLEDASLSELVGKANPFADYFFVSQNLDGSSPDLDGSSIQFLDLDGDGDDDLVIWNGDSVLMYQRVGKPTMNVRAGSANPLQALGGFDDGWFQPVDFDGDGDLDLIYRKIAYDEYDVPPIRYFERRSNANGDLIELNGPASPLSGLPPRSEIPYIADTFADWDGDGLVDCLRAEYPYDMRFGSGWRQIGKIRFWKHFANGSFLDVGVLDGIMTDTPSRRPFTVVDWNKDGLLDIVATRSKGHRGDALLYLRQEDNTFSKIELQGLLAKPVMWIDWNGDGRWDAIQADTVRVQTNVNGVFEPLPYNENPIAAACDTYTVCRQDDSEIWPADWDQDGDWDLLIHTVTPGYIVLIENGVCLDRRDCNKKGRCNQITDKCDCITGFEGSDCSSCQAGFFSKQQQMSFHSDSARECGACPAGKAAAAGSVSCSICSSGHVAGITSGQCSPCPAGKVPNSGASQCENCQGGKFAMIGSANCSVCPAGQVAVVGSGQCSLCPAGTIPNSAASQCKECGAGKYATDVDSECQECQPGRFSGEIGATSSSACMACSKGSYAEDNATAACKPCGEKRTTESTASASANACFCEDGYYEDPDKVGCVLCPPGYHCAMGERTKCPTHASSKEGKSRSSDCLCDPGHYLRGSSCEPCRPGFYKQDASNDICIFQCLAGANTTPGATSAKDCFCERGSYAQLGSQDGSLIACVSCSVTGLRCRGGFERTWNSTLVVSPKLSRVHAMPIAEPGYYQTAIDVAVPCTVVDERSESVCLGGSACVMARTGGELPTGCFGDKRFGNACGPGSAGMTCSQCPLGYSRNAYPDLCQECKGNAMKNLVASLSFELSMQAVLNVALASMAATAAARGGTSMHSALIRIGAQWFAACSVITRFKLNQIPGFAWVQEQAQIAFLENCSQGHVDVCEGESAKTLYFQWPQGVTDTLNSLYSFVGLFPTVGPMQQMLECLFEGYSTSDRRQLSKMQGPAFVFLCYPVLLMLAIVICCGLLLYVGVPLCRALGIDLDPELMRNPGEVFDAAQVVAAARKLALETLRPKLEPCLHDQGLEWADVLPILETADDLADLQDAAADPMGFLARLLESSEDAARKWALAKLRPRLEPTLKKKGMDWSDLLHVLETIGSLREMEEVATDPELFFERLAGKTSLFAMLALRPRIEPYLKRRGLAWSSIRPILGSVAFERGESDEQLVSDPIAIVSQIARRYAEVQSGAHAIDDGTLVLPVEDGQAGARVPRAPPQPYIFGLFLKTSSPWAFLKQTFPVLSIAISNMWPYMLETFLKMIWCVPVAIADESGRKKIEQRLMRYPDVRCWSEDHELLSIIAMLGLSMWVVIAPGVLLLRIWWIGPNRQSPERARVYKYFIQGYEPRFWYWDLLVKRVDTGLMMLIAYTSIADDAKAKLLLFPIVSGLMLALNSWCQPLEDRQARLLDFIENCFLAARFMLFSCISVLMVFSIHANVTLVGSVALASALCLFTAYYLTHVVVQYAMKSGVPHKAEEGDADSWQEVEAPGKHGTDEGHEPWGFNPKAWLDKLARRLADSVLSAAVDAFLRCVRKLCQADESEKLYLLWDGASTARIGKKSSESPERRRIVRAARSVRAAIFRSSDDYQRDAVAGAMSDFISLCITRLCMSELLLDMRICCVLTLASKWLPFSTPSKEVKDGLVANAKAIMSSMKLRDSRPEDDQAVMHSFSGHEDGHAFSAEDICGMTIRFGNLPDDEARELLRAVQLQQLRPAPSADTWRSKQPEPAATPADRLFKASVQAAVGPSARRPSEASEFSLTEVAASSAEEGIPRRCCWSASTKRAAPKPAWIGSRDDVTAIADRGRKGFQGVGVVSDS